MSENLMFLYILSAIAVLIAWLTFLSGHLWREYQREVRKALALEPVSADEILTQEDIQHLPEPVQNYLIYVGAIGREKVHNMSVAADGEMDMNINAGWTPVKVFQHNFFGGRLTRLCYINAKVYKLPTYALHTYTDKIASMRVKPAGLFKVVDAKGPEMRVSDTITLLNDMCIFAPAALIDDRITWESVDDITVKATFTTSFCTVTAILYFNKTGELINFTSEDRYYLENDGSYQKVKWSTPVRDYREINGLRLISYGEAIWNLPGGDYSYFKFTNIKKIHYNCAKLE